MTEYDSPAEISPIVAPSFCACFTLEFINTVHLVPRSTGASAKSASFAKSFTSRFTDFAYVSMNEPHPEEHASFSMILYIAPSLMRMHFLSTDVQDKINTRQKFLRRLVVSHGLDLTQIRFEC